MKSLWINFILIAALIVATNNLLVAQTPEQLYQKGLMKEEGEGALQDAIDLYSQIADNSNAGQSLRAKALLHIGMCHEKLGTQEAVKAYQRLVNNFPSQKNEVAAAKERLNRLILTENLALKDEKKDLLIRKVLANTDIEPLGDPSPDGRYISFTDWNSGGNVGILDLKTEERRLLTDFKNQEAYYSSWSPDGQQIAYFWSRYDEGQYNHIGLSVVDIKKAESRDLFISDYDKYGWIELGNWSSDGKYIFATLSLSEEPKSQLVRVSAVDGTIEILKTFETSYTGGKPWVSPDNRFIAYDLPDKDASGNSDIFLLSLENGQENPLIKHPAHDYILGWVPDGESILFASDRSGTVDAMLIAVREGKPVDQPRPVTQNIGPIVPMGFIQEGSFYYGQWPGAQNIFSAEININEGKLLSNPILLIQRFEGRNNSPDYSYDGKYLAYISGRGILIKGEPGGVLCIRNLETGEENEIIPDPEIGRISNPQWSPDDQSIALACENKDGYARIYKYDIQTRKFTPLVTKSDNDLPDTEYAYPLWSLDGKSIYYLQLSPSSQNSYIKVRNISTGVNKELFRYSSDDFMDRLFNISLSPDGRWLAAINRGKNRTVRLISTEDGKTSVLHTFESSGGYPYSQVWSKDGKYIIFPYPKHLSQEAREWNLMRIPFKGGESRLIEMNIHGVSSPSLHPDGQTLSFTSAGYSLPEINIWEMKNFLPSDHDVQDKASTEAGASEEIAIRQVWSGQATDGFGSVSADGGYLSFTDWETGNLAVRNLKTGENKQVSHDGTWIDSTQFAEYSLISPDGNQYAYTWYNKNINYELRLLKSGNPNPITLYSCKNFDEYIIPCAWFSDVNKIIAQKSNNTTRIWQLVSINTSSGEIEVLKEQLPGPTPGPSFMNQISLSPDEKYLAFDFPNTSGNGMFDINILSLDAKQESPLVKHPANDRLLGWLPGRNEMLFVSDRSGTTDIWGLSVSDGKPIGVPRRILTNVGDIDPMGFTYNGSLFSSVMTIAYESFIVPFDSESGNPTINSRISISGQLFGCTWLPDGESLVCTRLNQKPAERTRINIVLVNSKTGKSRTLADNLNIFGHFRISPDGKSVIANGYDVQRLNEKDYKGGIYIVDIETGLMNEIKVSRDVSHAFCCEWDKEGRNIFYCSNNQLIKHNIETGDEKVINNNVYYGTIMIRSHDENNLLFNVCADFNKDLFHLLSIPVNGGDADTLVTYQATANPRLNRIALSPDGKYIYLSTRAPGLRSVLSRIPAAGGAIENLWQSTYYFIAGISIHHQEKQIALSTFETTTEIRSIDNLDKKVAEVFSKTE